MKGIWYHCVTYRPYAIVMLCAELSFGIDLVISRSGIYIYIIYVYNYSLLYTEGEITAPEAYSVLIE